MKVKECPACGSTFSCHADEDVNCWCMNYQLSTSKLKEIADNYSGCLCEACLKKKQVEDVNIHK